MRSVRLEVVATIEIPIGEDQVPQIALSEALQAGADHPETLVQQAGASVSVTGFIVSDGEPTSWPRRAAEQFLSDLSLSKV